ncbi:multicopper oxidase, partial [Lepidopterella palustris CBS 459.81]
MAISLSNFLNPISVLLLYVLRCNAVVITYDFNVSWVYANPDGAYNRPVIGINGQWPVPPITATKGDRIIVNVNNQLGNETTSLHFHGLFMNGTSHMDGPPGVTQCEIAPGKSFTYNFTVEQPGTYWYHSHTRGQYPDGLRGPLIIHDPDSPYKDLYDEEVVLTFSDWYHDLMHTLLPKFISLTNPTGAEPVPKASLINDTQNVKVFVQPGKTYLFRMVNMGAFAGQYLWFEGHTMQIVEVDGIYTFPEEVNMIYITAAQRYSVLVTAKNHSESNSPFVTSMDQDLFDKVPKSLNPNVTGWLIYDDSKPLPPAAMIENFDPFDDFNLIPHDLEPLYDHVDYALTLDLKMGNLGDGANYAFFNNITYVPPKVPTLYTALSTGGNATNAVVYGENTNSFVLNKGDIVQIILNSADSGKHPFHLHGHAFQVAVRSEADEGPYVTDIAMPPTPMRRDTIMVNPNGNFVLRFRADNPGIWLFHCHIEWHVASGLIATMVEAPLTLQQTLSGKIPADHLSACHDTNTPTAGNAAGNTINVLDLAGAPRPPPPLPTGFTARGIVALVFSVISAFAGLAVIAWYGAAPLGAV